jgi:hypothetical protein
LAWITPWLNDAAFVRPRWPIIAVSAIVTEQVERSRAAGTGDFVAMRASLQRPPAALHTGTPLVGTLAAQPRSALCDRTFRSTVKYRMISSCSRELEGAAGGVAVLAMALERFAAFAPWRCAAPAF